MTSSRVSPPEPGSSASLWAPIAILGVFDFTPEAAAFDHGSPALREILRRIGLRREVLARTGLVLKTGPDKAPEETAAGIRRALGLGGPTICLPEASDSEICGLAASLLRRGQALTMLAGGPAAGEDAAGIALFKRFDLALQDGDPTLGLLEPEQARPPARPPFRLDDLGVLRLWPLQASGFCGLAEALENLERELESGADLDRAHRARLAAWSPAARLPTAALLGAKREEIRDEARALRRALAQKPKFWTSPAGSAFVARPLGPKAPIAFVHAGRLEERVFHGARITEPLPPRRRAEEALLDGPALSSRLAGILTEGLGLKPAFAFGHGLIGEIGALTAAGVWTSGVDPGATLRGSDLASQGLSGRKDLARRYFGLEEDEPDDLFWTAARLSVDADSALEAAAKREDMFVVSVDSPRAVAAAGLPEALEEFAAELGAQLQPAPDLAEHILHCDLARMGFSEAAALFRQPSRTPRGAPALISGRDFRPIRDWSPAGLSWALAEILCAPAEFRRLTETAYEEGARIFVECGPGLGLAARIDETLAGLPHAALALQAPGVAPERAFWSAAARLTAEGLRLDPAALASGPLAAPRPYGLGFAALTGQAEPLRLTSERRLAAGRRIGRRVWDSAMADALETHRRFAELQGALKLGIGSGEEGPGFGPKTEVWMRKWAAEGSA